MPITIRQSHGLTVGGSIVIRDLDPRSYGYRHAREVTDGGAGDTDRKINGSISFYGARNLQTIVQIKDPRTGYNDRNVAWRFRQGARAEFVGMRKQSLVVLHPSHGLKPGAKIYVQNPTGTKNLKVFSDNQNADLDPGPHVKFATYVDKGFAGRVLIQNRDGSKRVYSLATAGASPTLTRIDISRPTPGPSAGSTRKVMAGSTYTRIQVNLNGSWTTLTNATRLQNKKYEFRVINQAGHSLLRTQLAWGGSLKPSDEYASNGYGQLSLTVPGVLSWKPMPGMRTLHNTFPTAARVRVLYGARWIDMPAASAVLPKFYNGMAAKVRVYTKGGHNYSEAWITPGQPMHTSSFQLSATGALRPAYKALYAYTLYPDHRIEFFDEVSGKWLDFERAAGYAPIQPRWNTKVRVVNKLAANHLNELVPPTTVTFGIARKHSTAGGSLDVQGNGVIRFTPQADSVASTQTKIALVHTKLGLLKNGLGDIGAGIRSAAKEENVDALEDQLKAVFHEVEDHMKNLKNLNDYLAQNVLYMNEKVLSGAHRELKDLSEHTALQVAALPGLISQLRERVRRLAAQNNRQRVLDIVNLVVGLIGGVATGFALVAGFVNGFVNAIPRTVRDRVDMNNMEADDAFMANWRELSALRQARARNEAFSDLRDDPQVQSTMRLSDADWKRLQTYDTMKGTKPMAMKVGIYSSAAGGGLGFMAQVYTSTMQATAQTQGLMRGEQQRHIEALLAKTLPQLMRGQPISAPLRLWLNKPENRHLQELAAVARATWKQSQDVLRLMGPMQGDMLAAGALLGAWGSRHRFLKDPRYRFTGHPQFVLGYSRPKHIVNISGSGFNLTPRVEIKNALLYAVMKSNAGRHLPGTPVFPAQNTKDINEWAGHYPGVAGKEGVEAFNADVAALRDLINRHLKKLPTAIAAGEGDELQAWGYQLDLAGLREAMNDGYLVNHSDELRALINAMADRARFAWITPPMPGTRAYLGPDFGPQQMVVLAFVPRSFAGG